MIFPGFISDVSVLSRTLHNLFANTVLPIFTADMSKFYYTPCTIHLQIRSSLLLLASKFYYPFEYETYGYSLRNTYVNEERSHRHGQENNDAVFTDLQIWYSLVLLLTYQEFTTRPAQ